MDSKQIYCLKCRKATGNKDLYIDKIIVKGNKRMMEKCLCIICGKRKNRFIKMLPVIVDEMTP